MTVTFGIGGLDLGLERSPPWIFLLTPLESIYLRRYAVNSVFPEKRKNYLTILSAQA